MKVSESLQNESIATENELRRAVDTTPAFIHTARPDRYLDYFNRGWLDFLGKSFEDVCGWRWTESIHPEDVAAIESQSGFAYVWRFVSKIRNEKNMMPNYKKKCPSASRPC